MSDIALDTGLLRQYFLFYAHKDYDVQTVTKLFARLRPFLCTIQQLLDCGIPQEILPAILATQGQWRIYTPSDSTLSEVALYKDIVLHSRFQILLSNHDIQSPDFVCINIHDNKDPMQLLYVGRYKENQNRDRVLLHLQNLIASAHDLVEILDNYMDENYAPLLTQILKNCTCRINCHTHSTRQSKLSRALRGSTNVTVKEYDPTRKHDRYIVIDNSLEILLSSGIRSIQDTQKDFTYVIRDK